ncbi:HRDC domain-containing protein [Paenibacillus protaetiae]|uniref:Aldolase n=1 Tax=Paenibacillus protaetiae TaxID=2509456 RepID=A0A4P6F850_9BACL|nr:HRDC domain-containing protein [Paenibacillus protaetiae]QAY66618.1 aldolase [Paenibacillus protaetiae]
MQIVFLNTFEKKTAAGGVASAQLSICAKEGVWAVLWMGEGAEGNPDTWFEGPSWEEMLAAFRYGVAGRMREGYVPVIDGMLEAKPAGASFAGMLQCYGELHADKELFEQLRDWRRAKSAALKKSAYLIASNRMLWMISAYVPQTKEELLQIPGWGDSKHSEYGDEVLAITGEARRETDFPLDWVSDRLDQQLYMQWMYKQKEMKYKQELERQHEKKKMLQLAQQGGRLDAFQTELELTRRQIVDRLEQLDAEGYDFAGLIEEELADMPEVEQQLIWDAFEKLGDRYLKPVLHEVYGERLEQEKSVDLLYEKLRLLRMKFRKNSSSVAV